MKHTLPLFLFILLCPSARAQQYATIPCRQSELPHAVPVMEIDSEVVCDVTGCTAVNDEMFYGF